MKVKNTSKQKPQKKNKEKEKEKDIKNKSKPLQKINSFSLLDSSIQEILKQLGYDTDR